MGREIKFRAWNESENGMVDLQLITPLALDSMMNDQLAMKGGSGLFLPFLEGITLMQYTGLKDKNGVEIYESDVVSYPDSDDSSNCVVQFEGGAFYGNAIMDIDDGANLLLSEFCSDYVVIGNIYESPDLLEDK